MTVPFPEATTPASSRTEVFLRYLDYFRATLAAKMAELPAAGLRDSTLPSGWTPLELLKHLRHAERRWLEWGFEGRAIKDPWGDRRDGRWYVAPDETLDSLLAELTEQAARSRAIITAHDLDEVGQPSERWDGADPATLERVLFHLLQEYARHVGHLDIVTELAVGVTGELRFVRLRGPWWPGPVRLHGLELVPAGIPFDLGRVAVLQQIQQVRVLPRRLGGAAGEKGEHGGTDPVQPVVGLLDQLQQVSIAALGDDLRVQVPIQLAELDRIGFGFHPRRELAQPGEVRPAKV